VNVTNSLETQIGRLLQERGLKLVLAESCTGGLLGSRITDVPGSSEYFLGGAISYSNQLKQSILGVKAQTLEAHGAVSEETVREMANGARLKFHTDYAIAITGIAGPVGGTSDKPVGTVWMAVADAQGVVSLKRTFGKDRLRNIELSAVYALDMLRKRITNEVSG
jgi:nicotinamide-nucleotide amidase